MRHETCGNLENRWREEREWIKRIEISTCVQTRPNKEIESNFQQTSRRCALRKAPARKVPSDKKKRRLHSENDDPSPSFRTPGGGRSSGPRKAGGRQHSVPPPPHPPSIPIPALPALRVWTFDGTVSNCVAVNTGSVALRVWVQSRELFGFQERLNGGWAVGEKIEHNRFSEGTHFFERIMRSAFLRKISICPPPS